jgi:hypothetical protein
VREEPISVLYDFIDTAERNKKYPSNTAQGLRAAIKLFESSMNEQERASLQTVSDNLDQIFESVGLLNKQFSAATLTTYRARLQKLLKDYATYGGDQAKIAQWRPRTRQQKPKESTQPSRQEPNAQLDNVAAARIHTLEIGLEHGRAASVRVPHDLRPAEADLLIGLLRTLTDHST